MTGPSIPARPGIPAGPGPPQAPGFGQGADHQSRRRLDRAHLALPAQAFRLLQGRLDIGDADVDDHVTVIIRAPPRQLGCWSRRWSGRRSRTRASAASTPSPRSGLSGRTAHRRAPELLDRSVNDFEVHMDGPGHSQSSLQALGTRRFQGGRSLPADGRTGETHRWPSVHPEWCGLLPEPQRVWHGRWHAGHATWRPGNLLGRAGASGAGQADQVALGIGEVADDQAGRRLDRAHLALPAQALGPLQRRSTLGTPT